MDRQARDRSMRVLRKRGFKPSSYKAESGQYVVRASCDQCQAMCINGVACHEQGCPNEKKT